MKVSLKVGFGGNCILRQEVANFTLENKDRFFFLIFDTIRFPAKIQSLLNTNANREDEVEGRRR